MARPVIARVAWFGGLALLALIALGAQLDRASRRMPELATLVPQPFRNTSQYWITAIAQASNAPEARAEAELLLVRRPIPAENLTLYAITMMRSGDVPQSTEAFRIAAGRGWRSAMAQRMTGLWAAAAGENRMAFLRLVALAKTGDATADDFKVLREIIKTPEGRAGMVQLLRDDWHWRRAMDYLAPQLMTPADTARIYAEAARQGAEIGCSQVGEAVRLALSRGDASAMPYWETCGGAAQSGRQVMSFADADTAAPTAPHAWQLDSNADIAVLVEGDGDNAELVFDSRSGLGARIASAYATMGPGTWRLSAQAIEGRATFDVQCVGPEGRPGPRWQIQPDAVQAIAIPSSGCAVQRLELSSRGPAGRIAAPVLQRAR